MKVVKPQRIGVLFHPYEQTGEFFLSVTGMLFFPFEAPSHLLTEMNLWKFAAVELGKDGVLDVGMPKPRGELLLTARAYPHGGAQIACSVRASMGGVDKSLHVIGDREWRRDGSTDPTPFTEMPITYAHAFGGARFPQNPVGKGFEPIEASGETVHPLPNIEDPRHLIRSPNDRPAPAGFGPYDLMWPQRFLKIGTYDNRWLETRAPGLADDLDPTFFNAAPDDQQIAGRFSPGEKFRLENMHPDKGVIESALPHRVVRCFVALRDREKEGLTGLIEVPMMLETVHLFPHAERGIVLFRGQQRVSEDDAADVQHALFACEVPAAPRERAHYEDVLRRRLDKKNGAMASLREADLLPEPEGTLASPEPSEVDEMTSLVTLKGAKERNLRNLAVAEREKLVARIVAEGLDPSVVPLLPPPESVPDLDKLPELVASLEKLAEEQRAQAEKAHQEAVAAARAACEAEGRDFDALVEEERAKSAGPPKFTADGELERLRGLAELTRNAGGDASEIERVLDDRGFRSKLVRSEEALRDAYVRYADLFPKARRLSGREAAAVRERVERALAAKESLAGQDLTGADLSGLDLRAIDLRGAMLESADLTGADVREAHLEGAVLAKADLSGATLDDARLADANLGGADLSSATLRSADLTRAVFRDIKLRGADLSGAKLDGAQIIGADLRRTTFDGVSAAGALFMQCNLVAARFERADLTKAIFLETPVSDATFAECKLVKALFLATHGDGANFDGADAENLRAVNGCSFEEATFRGAKLGRANFRGAKLRLADFAGAAIDGGDFSEADMRGASLARAVLRGALFVRTNLRDANLEGANLMNAVLQKAVLRGAKLVGANLVRADLLRIDVDQGTDLTSAELAEARFVKREARHEQG